MLSYISYTQEPYVQNGEYLKILEILYSVEERRDEGEGRGMEEVGEWRESGKGEWRDGGTEGRGRAEGWERDGRGEGWESEGSGSGEGGERGRGEREGRGRGRGRGEGGQMEGGEIFALI